MSWIGDKQSKQVRCPFLPSQIEISGKENKEFAFEEAKKTQRPSFSILEIIH